MLDYGLSSQQLAVICALSTGATMTAAAEQAGVHRNTINNWRRNLLPFQQALADAQYDRALLVRERIEDQVDLALKAIQKILADPKTPPSVRLKAALAILQTAATPPQPKKQIELQIEKVAVMPSQSPRVHNDAQPSPTRAIVQPVHNPAQPPVPIRRDHPKVGRNETCPCGSGQKFKRCCLDGPRLAAAS